MKRKKKNTINNIWIFFIIVAVGLVLSWGQVGEGYKQKLQDNIPQYLLRTEKDCDFLKAPCAAFAPDYAIVVKMQQNQGWKTFLIRAAGKPLSPESRLQLKFLSSSTEYDDIPLPIRFKEPDIWFSDTQLPLPKNGLSWSLRVRVTQDEKIFVADFPLPQD